MPSLGNVSVCKSVAAGEGSGRTKRRFAACAIRYNAAPPVPSKRHFAVLASAWKSPYWMRPETTVEFGATRPGSSRDCALHGIRMRD